MHNANGLQLEVHEAGAEYLALEDLRALPRALMGGTSAMREAGTAYLPMYPKEEVDEWELRRDSTFLTPFFSEAVESLVGRVLAKPLVIDNLSPKLQELWSDIDQCGSIGEVFLREIFVDSAAEGVGGILVDFPEALEGETVADERAKRPFWVRVNPSRLLETSPLSSGLSQNLTRVRLRTHRLVPDGQWGWIPLAQIRVFWSAKAMGTDYAMVQLWEEDEPTSNKFIPMGPARPLKPLREIPLALCTTGPSMRPPLMNLASLCEQHWRKKSSLDQVVGVIGRPPFVILGASKKEAEIAGWGPMRFVYVNSPQVKAAWAELKGDALPIAVKDLERLESHIRIAAQDPVRRDNDSGGDMQSWVRVMDEARGASRLQTWAMSWIDAANRAIDFTGQWLGVKVPGYLTIAEEVMSGLTVDSGLQELIELRKLDAISVWGVQYEAKRRGTLGRDWDIDADLKRLEEERATVVEGTYNPNTGNDRSASIPSRSRTAEVVDVDRED